MDQNNTEDNGQDGQKFEHSIEQAFSAAFAGGVTKSLVGTNDQAEEKKEIIPDGFVPILNKKQYLEIINEVLDPETGIGIVDMGLIYDVIEYPSGMVEVEMTLTSLGCPAGGQITTEISAMLRLQSHVKDVKINLVWEPPWNPEMMNPDVKAMLLGTGGFNVFGI